MIRRTDTSPVDVSISRSDGALLPMATTRKTSKRADEPIVWQIFQRRGTVPILLLLNAAGSIRFTDVVENLPQVHRTIVAQRLGELREVSLIEREVQEGPPVTTQYSLTRLGGELAKAAVQLDEVARRVAAQDSPQD